MNAGVPILFRSYSSVHSYHETCTIWQAARATSAKPGFFEHIKIGRQQPYIDGGFGCNNPANLVLEEAAELFSGRKLASLISIGCGHPPTARLPKGDLGAMNEMFRLMTEDCEKTHEEMVKRFSGHPELYHRFNVEQSLNDSRHYQSVEVEGHTIAYLSRENTRQRLAAAAEVSAKREGAVPVGFSGTRFQETANIS